MTSEETALHHPEIVELLHTHPRLTLQAIGDRVGLTRERIRQINVALGPLGRLKPERIGIGTMVIVTFIPNRDAFAEYRAYCQAKRSCTYPPHPSYSDYGGRGIEFRFHSFSQWYAELGKRPEGKLPSGRSLYRAQRIDKTRHFEPSNVKWTRRKEVSNKHRKSLNTNFMERYWKRMQIGTDDDCWPWTGKVASNGYGYVQTHAWVDESGTTHQSVALAHRISYFLCRGDIPPELECDHLCNNKPCCNPWHLELVTKQINCAREAVRQYEGGNCPFLPGTAIVCTDLLAWERIGALTSGSGTTGSRQAA